MNIRKVWGALGVLVVAVALWNCTDDDISSSEKPDGGGDVNIPDEPGTTPSKKLTFNVPARGIWEGDRHWIILSDDKGNLLDTAELKNGRMYTFSAPATFTPDDVTVTLFAYGTEGPNYAKPQRIIRTYVGLPFGDYGYGAVPETLPVGVRSTVTINQWDFITGSNIVMGSPGIKNYGYSGGVDLTFNFDLIPEKAYFLASLIDNDGSYQYIYDQIARGQNLTYEKRDLKHGDFRNISVPAGHTINYKLSATTAQGGDFLYSTVFYEMPQASTISIAYIKDLFTSYKASFTAKKDGIYNTHYVESVNLPETMKTLDGNIDYQVYDDVIISNQPETCDFAWYRVIGQNANTDVSWLVWCKSGKQTVVVPAMPRKLAQTYTLPSFGNLYTDAYEVTATLSKYPDYNGYVDCVAHVLSADGLRDRKEFIEKYTYEAR